MKSYYARAFGDARVLPDGGASFRLDPRLDLRNHSPTGYAWGYAGSGPAQLALAILCDALCDDERAARLYQRFKERAIATRSREQPFEITYDQVMESVESIERELSP